MARSFSLTLMLFSAAAAATIVACGGDDSSSKTPGASETARTATSQAGKTAGAAQTAAPGGTSQPALVTAAAVNTTTAATVAAAAGASVVPVDATPSVPFPGITVLPDGTATNSQGTPVVLPTASTSAPTPGAAATPSSGTTPGVEPTSGAASGTTISFEPPASPGGDFDVNILVTGVPKPYVAFNVYVTFDPAIVSPIVIKPGTALSASPDDMFCARAPQTSGAVGLGCTVIQGPSAATNGLLATIRFRQVASGTTALHLKTVAEGGATTGTYTSTPAQGAQPVPDIVTLIDGSITIP